jgi:phosphoribosyl 1,2-cyclic phosphodiesterase|nr:MAG TPA: YycJ-like MBL-fold protein [Bacteriophage sp.]
MKLKCIATGSTGNCYTLTSDSGETLILDCGIPIKEIKKGLNWNIRNVVGCIVSHVHSDHSKSLNDFNSMGIPVFAPYEKFEPHFYTKIYGEFEVKDFPLTTTDNRWTHTNADGTPCPIYGFLITHKEMGRMLYITDCEVVKWKFRDINHILLGVNYDKDLIDRDNTGKANHVFRGHLSIDTACDFVKANHSDSLQNVIMCHLSSENADSGSFIEKMKKVAYGANVDVAERGKECILRKGDECPF